MRVGLCSRRRAVAPSGVGLKSPARLGMKVVWFFSERFLFFLPREALFLLPRAICYPQASEKNGGACIMTYSGREEERAPSIYRAGPFATQRPWRGCAVPKLFPEGFRSRIFSSAEILSRVHRKVLF